MSQGHPPAGFTAEQCCPHGLPFSWGPCRTCEADGIISGVEHSDAFSLAMARVEELREARRADLARRDRAEWECFFHFACENSLLKRQAE
jgi:hypothetical protein